MRIWSASEGSQKSMLTDLVGAVTSVTLQPSGRYFAASGELQTLRSLQVLLN